jgi:hypothetical protein
MLKLLIFAILLASIPVNSLLESLFQTENDCYSGCHSNYATSLTNLDACKKGCDYKLHNEKCADQCKTFSMDKQAQASCLVGCSMSHLVDPIPSVNLNKVQEIKESIEGERPRSIILIRLRQRPLVELPSFNRVFNNDPIQMFNHMIKQLKENRNENEQSKTIFHLVKNIPIIKLPTNIRIDSSNEENSRLHRQGHIQSLNNRFKQFLNDVRTEWNDLIRKQPKIPIWILLSIFLSSSIILWYMIISLCRQKSAHRTFAIRAEELHFFDTYEKEKIQPNNYEIIETSPMKFKLKNI